MYCALIAAASQKPNARDESYCFFSVRYSAPTSRVPTQTDDLVPLVQAPSPCRRFKRNSPHYRSLTWGISTTATKQADALPAPQLPPLPCEAFAFLPHMNRIFCLRPSSTTAANKTPRPNQRHAHHHHHHRIAAPDCRSLECLPNSASLESTRAVNLKLHTPNGTSIPAGPAEDELSVMTARRVLSCAGVSLCPARSESGRAVIGTGDRSGVAFMWTRCSFCAWVGVE